MSPTKAKTDQTQDEPDQFGTPSEFSTSEFTAASSKPVKTKAAKKKQERDPNTPVRRSNRTKKTPIRL